MIEAAVLHSRIVNDKLRKIGDLSSSEDFYSLRAKAPVTLKAFPYGLKPVPFKARPPKSFRKLLSPNLQTQAEALQRQAR
jgi:hypothetical protein